MGFIIGIIVVFILYKLFFHSGAKQNPDDATIEAAVKLGIPASDAQRICNGQVFLEGF